MVSRKCGQETGTCQDLKIELEIELHRTKESIEHAEMRLKQVELESKQQMDKLQDIKCKVRFSFEIKQYTKPYKDYSRISIVYNW